MSRKGEIAKDILAVLGAVGLIAVALTAPNVIQLFGPKYRSSRKRYQFKRSLGILEQKELVSIGQKDGKTIIKLTKNGKKKVLEYKIEEMKLKKPKIWDKKWRLVIFDIPVKFNQARLVLTSKLKEMGFAMVQKSVWISPYECEDEIDFIKEVYELRPFVRVVTAEKLDIAGDLLTKFNLV